jgi:hypothetical protein
LVFAVLKSLKTWVPLGDGSPLSPLSLPAMTYSDSLLLVIPTLAIAYLVLVYGGLTLAKWATRSRRTEG